MTKIGKLKNEETSGMKTYKHKVNWPPKNDKTEY